MRGKISINRDEICQNQESSKRDFLKIEGRKSILSERSSRKQSVESAGMSDSFESSTRKASKSLSLKQDSFGSLKQKSTTGSPGLSDQFKSPAENDQFFLDEDEFKTFDPGMNSDPEAKQALKKLSDMMDSRRKGEEVRTKVVFINEIKTFLEAHMKDFKNKPGKKAFDLDAMSKILAREILELSFSDNPESLSDYEGHGKFLGKNDEKTYNFPVFDKQGTKHVVIGTQKIPLPVDLWIKKKPDGTGIEIEMVGKKLGKGSFKTVRESKVLEINLQSIAHDKSLSDYVVVRPNKMTSKAQERVLEGANFLKKYFPELGTDPELRLAGNYSLTDRLRTDFSSSPSSSGSSRPMIEPRDIRYRGDLEQLADKLNSHQLRQIFADISKTLQKMHAKSWVHSDIKPHNILVSNGDNPHGFISDFDTVVKPGEYKGLTQTYADWLLKEQKIATPFTDVYALAKMTLEILGPEEDTLFQLVENVFQEDARIEKWWSDSHNTLQVQQLLKKLQDPKSRQQAMEELYHTFPAFQNFLQEISKLSANS